MPDEMLTVGDVARKLNQPEWLVRRVVDKHLDALRFGGKRIILASQVKLVAREIEHMRNLHPAKSKG